MIMIMRRYNIIWADDDIDAILRPRDKEILRDKECVDLLSTPKTGKQLREALRVNINKVDAVIVDANFDSEEEVIENERSISGLRVAIELYKRYNEEEKRGIPFYLYTGRKMAEVDAERADKNGINEIFISTGRRFEKANGYKRMITSLKDEVDKVNTPLFKARRKYYREFQAASLIPGATELLLKSVLFEFSDEVELDPSELYFNPLRMIWEQIESECKKRGILPNITKLNSMASFLLGEEVEYCQLTKPIMPMALAHSLKYFLSITQDGSHTKDDLSLKVIEYVREIKNGNLYRSVLSIALDLLLWYESYLPPVEKPWKVKYELIEAAKATPEGNRFYVGNILLLKRKNGPLVKAGDLIGIRELARAIDNLHPFSVVIEDEIEANAETLSESVDAVRVDNKDSEIQEANAETLSESADAVCVDNKDSGIQEANADTDTKEEVSSSNKNVENTATVTPQTIEINKATYYYEILA